jgi:magnesium transporter
MTHVFVHLDGVTRQVPEVDPAWLQPDAREVVWVDFEAPGDAERRMLLDVFGLHELAVEDAMEVVHHPKVEAYERFLYLILHRIVPATDDRGFQTQDVDFFLGRNFLVTVHHTPSDTLAAERGVCGRHNDVLGEGAVSMMHRIVDRMVDRYQPAVDGLEERLERLEEQVFRHPTRNPLRAILALKRDVVSLRRVALPQRDAIGRLARREFAEIPELLSYRFRDVYDHLVRLTDEAIFFQDRVSGLLDVYLSAQSNRLNQVMKVLTVIATIFMPLTVLTGMWGMNLLLPAFPGGAGLQFWWVFGVMLVASGAMLWVFRRMGWL